MKRHAEEAAPAPPAALPARPKGIPQGLGPPAPKAEATHPWEEVRAEPCTTLPLRHRLGQLDGRPAATPHNKP